MSVMPESQACTFHVLLLCVTPQVAVPERETELKCEIWMASHHRGTAEDQLLGFVNINIK